MRRILVTTVKRGYPVEKSGALYIYDWDNKEVIDQCGMLPLNARFSRNPRGGIRGLRGACIDEKEEKIYVASNDTITVLNYKLEMLYTIEHRLFCNLHEIKKYDEKLFIASCGNDKILIVRCDEGRIEADIFWELNKDTGFACNKIDSHGEWRPNSLGLNSENELYVAFAKKNEIRKLYNGHLLNVKTRTPHNIILEGSIVCYNSSIDSKTQMYDSAIDLNRTIFEDKKKWYWINTKKARWGWLRGMDKVKEDLIVGSSPYARVILLKKNRKFHYNSEIVKISRNRHEAVYTVLFFKEDWE